MRGDDEGDRGMRGVDGIDGKDGRDGRDGRVDLEIKMHGLEERHEGSAHFGISPVRVVDTV